MKALFKSSRGRRPPPARPPPSHPRLRSPPKARPSSAPPAADAPRCARCGGTAAERGEATLFCCNLCKTVEYCSKACQSAALWAGDHTEEMCEAAARAAFTPAMTVEEMNLAFEERDGELKSSKKRVALMTMGLDNLLM